MKPVLFGNYNYYPESTVSRAGNNCTKAFYSSNEVDPRKFTEVDFTNGLVPDTVLVSTRTLGHNRVQTKVIRPAPAGTTGNVLYTIITDIKGQLKKKDDQLAAGENLLDFVQTNVKRHMDAIYTGLFYSYRSKKKLVLDTEKNTYNLIGFPNNVAYKRPPKKLGRRITRKLITNTISSKKLRKGN
jgi:hypothetical protein